MENKLIPKDRRRAKVAKELLENVAKEPTFIKGIITGDEECVSEYNV